MMHDDKDDFRHISFNIFVLCYGHKDIFISFYIINYEFRVEHVV